MSLCASAKFPRLLFLIVVSVLSGNAQEILRNGRIRFPSDHPPQLDLGPQLFEAESQGVPVLIQGGNGINTPHFILPKVQSTINPFGQVNQNGYAEGLIVPYYQQPGGQGEYHQTLPPLPPPQRQAQYGPTKVYSPNNNGQPILQNHNRHPAERQPERHRFGPQQRLPFLYQGNQRPQNQYPPKQYIQTSHQTKEHMPQLPDGNFRYSFQTNHAPSTKTPQNENKYPYLAHHTPSKAPQQNEQYEQYKPEYLKGLKQPSQNKPKGQGHKHSEDDFPEDFSAEFDQGVPDWQLKGNFQDDSFESEVFFNKKQKGQKNRNPEKGFPSSKPHFEGGFPSSKPNFERGFPSSKPKYEGGFPSSKPNSEGGNPSSKPNFAGGFPSSKPNFDGGFPSFDDIPEYPGFPNKNNKRFSVNRPNTGYKRGEVKSVYEPTQESVNHDFKYKKQNGKRPNHRESIKSIETASFEDFSGEKYFGDFDFPEKQSKKQQPEASNFGSEWIPINAPEGIVPAKSYDIPAPDLSRGSFKDIKTIQNISRRERPRDWDEGNGRLKGDLVYGRQKPSNWENTKHRKATNGEEVVSAVVRVKQ